MIWVLLFVMGLAWGAGRLRRLADDAAENRT